MINPFIVIHTLKVINTLIVVNILTVINTVIVINMLIVTLSGLPYPVDDKLVLQNYQH